MGTIKDRIKTTLEKAEQSWSGLNLTTDPTRSGSLTIAIQAAVPIWIERIKRDSWESVQRRMDEHLSSGLADKLGSRGDVLLFGGGKKGEVAELFNGTAEAVALMSFIPGGVEIFGCHWESIHPERKDNEE